MSVLIVTCVEAMAMAMAVNCGSSRLTLDLIQWTIKQANKSIAIPLALSRFFWGGRGGSL